MRAIPAPLDGMLFLAMREHVGVGLERARTVQARVQINARVDGQMLLCTLDTMIRYGYVDIVEHAQNSPAVRSRA